MFNSDIKINKEFQDFLLHSNLFFHASQFPKLQKIWEEAYQRGIEEGKKKQKEN